MTIEELQVKRDKILAQLAQPLDARGPGGMGVTNRSAEDLQSALNVIDAQIAKLSSSSSVRTTLATFNKG